MVNKILFYVWGLIGLICNGWTLAEMISTQATGKGIGVGTSCYAAFVTLLWIGGMIFFAIAHMMREPALEPQPVPA